MKKKVLITVPDLKRPGGVAALYNILQLDKEDNCEYFELHGKFASRKYLRAFDLFTVFAGFIFKIKNKDVIHVNPSLDKKSFFRDGLLIYISLLLNKKVLVYWHGWQDAFEEQIHAKKSYYNFFKKTYYKAHTHIVLGTVFKEKLIKLGIKQDVIFVESNAADDTFLKNTPPPVKDDTINVLFIARLEVQKGIYIAIDAITQLSYKHNNLKLLVAGSGGAFNEVKAYAEGKGLSNIVFSGHIGGAQKHELFAKSDVLLFPTYYPEGMPISIIEAMLYGLPIITRPVGGIPDWVEENKNGFLIAGLEPALYAEKLERLITDRELLKKISENNKNKAQDYFTPDKVKARMLNYYESVKY